MRALRVLAGITPVVVLVAGCNQPPAQTSAAPASAQQTAAPAQSAVERGNYLVTNVAGCDDCHTPKTFGPQGPVPDMSRRMSGHPHDQKLPAVPAGLIGPTAWGAVTNNDFTAWTGAWGTSFTRNLTPDVATGLGSWTEDMFIQTIRKGKHQGTGRDLLPPMPWQDFAKMSDNDLKAIWAFLQSLPPINNAVPDPIPPAPMPK